MWLVAWKCGDLSSLARLSAMLRPPASLALLMAAVSWTLSLSDLSNNSSQPLSGPRSWWPRCSVLSGMGTPTWKWGHKVQGLQFFHGRQGALHAPGQPHLFFSQEGWVIDGRWRRRVAAGSLSLYLGHTRCRPEMGALGASDGGAQSVLLLQELLFVLDNSVRHPLLYEMLPSPPWQNDPSSSFLLPLGQKVV